MKKKYFNIILILVVAFIWGKLIYKYTRNSTQVPMLVSQPKTNKTSINIEKTSFKIKNLDRDPFLNKMVSKKTKKKHKKIVKKAIVSKNITWPRISYLGFIKNKNTTKKLAILKVNGSIKNIKEATFFNENIYIRKIYKDSIILQLNKQLKTIKK